jgi:hypothetical protein
MTEPVKVAVVNQSSLDDQDVVHGIAAIQKQISEDFAPVWHVDAQLEVVGKDRLEEKRPGHWGLILLDAVEDVRGYHDRTASGLPIAKVFVNEMGPSQDWTHAASHELLEMLADPDINLAVYTRPDALTMKIYAREICDPCAAYVDGYEVGGRWVSDFVFPSWFQESSLSNGAGFDERRLILAPFEVRPGGYIGVFDPSCAAWTMEGHASEASESKDVGSRLERRSTARNRWLTSDVIWAP